MKRPGVSELDQLHQLYDAKMGRGGRTVAASRDTAAGGSYSALHLAQGPSKPALPAHLPSNRLSVSKVTGMRSTIERGQATEMVRSAARSHHLNDAYVADMEALIAMNEEAARREEEDGDFAATFGPRAKLPGGGRSGGLSSSRAGAGGSGSSSSSLPRLVDAATYGDSGAGYSSSAAGSSLPTALPRSGWVPSAVPLLHRQWWRGPTDPAGTLVKLTDRPVMFIGIAPEAPATTAGGGGGSLPEVVLGTADHASYSVSLARGVCTRTLFGRRAGHTEWVTSTCFLGDGSGRVATAGMDGKIIVWEGDASAAGAGARRGGGGGGGGGPPRGEPRGYVEIDGAHFGSISCLCSPGGGLGSGSNQSILRGGGSSPFSPRLALLASSGYDKVIRLWSTATSGAGASTSRSVGGALARSGRALVAGGGGASAAPLPLLAELRGHGAPILSLALRPDLAEYTGEPASVSSGELLLASGDRDGVVKVWDVSAAVAAGGAAPAAKRGDAGSAGLVGTLAGHRGHITAMTWASTVNRYALPGVAPGAPPRLSPGPDPELHSLLFTGAQDGHFRAWDVRSKTPVANIELHVSDGGAGAVGDISVARVPTSPHFLSFAGGGDGGPPSPGSAFSGGSEADSGFETLVVTAGADRTVCVLDPRLGFSPRYRFTQHKDFLYSLHVVGPLCFSGAGDGMLITHDLTTGKPLWGLGANMAAVRCMATAGETLLAAGDDGSALVYSFN